MYDPKQKRHRQCPVCRKQFEVRSMSRHLKFHHQWADEDYWSWKTTGVTPVARTVLPPVQATPPVVREEPVTVSAIQIAKDMAIEAIKADRIYDAQRLLDLVKSWPTATG